jgi:hypothetical protein
VLTRHKSDLVVLEFVTGRPIQTSLNDCALNRCALIRDNHTNAVARDARVVIGSGISIVAGNSIGSVALRGALTPRDVLARARHLAVRRGEALYPSAEIIRW